ncbi:hypothetical protein [Archangium sp.]|uniref:hypothetical protein n=1 Tax=Archangium sp. TaxID=1872627 RepID=UPI00389A94F4
MSLRRRLLWLFPLCSLSAGCVAEPPSSPVGDERSVRDNPSVGHFPGDGPLAGGALAGDGGVADAGTDVVTVSASIRYLTASGLTTLPGQLASVPQLLVPQGDGTFVTVNGTLDASGSYVFSNIPKGTYYLKNGTGYVVTDARAVDVGYDQLGRSDAVRLTGVTSTSLNFNLANLSAWDPGAGFQMSSGEVDLMGAASLDVFPATGATALIGSGRLDNYTGEMPRFEAAKGDRAWVTQFSTQDAGTLPDGGTLKYTAVTRGLNLPAFSFDGGSPISVQGTMVDPPRTTIPFEWRMSSYAAQSASVHPQAAGYYSDLYVLPAAHGLANGWIGYSGELLTLDVPPNTGDLVRRVSFGNPYPSTWGVVGEVSHGFRVDVVVPGFNPTSAYGYLTEMDQLDRMIASPISLHLSPPRELTVDGVSAYISRMVGSVSPVIAWKPPAIGVPTAGYSVRLNKYSRTTPTSLNLKRTRMATFYVGPSATEVRLPPGVLEPATSYVVEVVAMSGAGDVSRAPYFVDVLPQYRASALTSVFFTP